MEAKLSVCCIDLERKNFKDAKVDITPTEGVAIIPYIMTFASLASAAALLFFMT